MAAEPAVSGDRNLGGSVDVFGDVFYPLYKRAFDEESTFVAEMEQKLAEARMPYNVEMYLSVALGLGVASGLLLWLVGLLGGYVLLTSGILPEGALLGISVPNRSLAALFEALREPMVVLVPGLLFGLLGFALVFVPFVMLPYSRASQRRREINLLLPDTVSFMYALSAGGMSHLEIFEAVAEADNTYGEVAREFRTVIQETEYFDTDYRTAIRSQAIETPSEVLAQFLTDMLSVINSGGDMTRFFQDKKDQHFRTAKDEQKQILDMLELLGEVYVTLSLFPLVLIIILVVLNVMGEGMTLVLYATVYVLIPGTGAVFLVILSTIKQDDPGTGVLRLHDQDGDFLEVETNKGLRDRGIVERFTGNYYLFDRIRKREGTYETLQLLKRPHIFFRDNPAYTLALTVPASFAIVFVAVISGTAPTTWEGMVNYPVWGTFIYLYVPLLLAGIPLAIFREWNVRSRRGITRNLSENLRKLASANDTGLTLLESMRTVADTTTGKLATEFETIYVKSTYGMNMKEALVVFNNKYQLPRLARTVNLIAKAQEASSQISSVLTTAAQATENQDEIMRERRARTRLQVAIVLMTYLTLLGVMAVLKAQFIDVLGNLAASAPDQATGFAASIDTNLISLLFFHAVTLQAVQAGLLCGYIRDAKLLAGMKYVVVLLTIAFSVWLVVG